MNTFHKQTASSSRYILTIYLFIASYFVYLPYANASTVNDDEKISKPGHGFLYSIEKDHKKSFILGSIHVGLSSDQNLDASTIQIASNARRIFVEADVRDATLAWATTVSAAQDENGPGLKSMIGEKYFNFFNTLFVERQKLFSYEQYSKSRTWFIVMLIPVSYPKIEIAPNLKFGTETQVLAIATEGSIPVSELEGIRGQLDVYNSMSRDYETPYFNDYVDLVQDRSIYKWDVADIEAWTKGNLGGIEDVMELREKRESAGNTFLEFFLDKVIKSRNFTFAKKIEEASQKSDNQLFVVGCGHLIGKDGVLSQLKQAGFDIHRIN